MRLPLLLAASLGTPLVVSTAAALQPSPARQLWDAQQERVVQLKPEEAFGSLLDLAVFGSFAPGVSLAEAEQRYGPPQQLFQGAYYDDWRYARYSTPTSFVDVAYEPGGDTCGTYHRRSLYAYPREDPWPIAAFLKGDLAARIGDSAGPTRVLIISADDNDRAWCLVRSGQVLVVNWLRTPAE